MESLEKLLNDLRDRTTQEAKLVPYEDGMREVLTLGSAYLIAASFLSRAFQLGREEGHLEYQQGEYETNQP